jgi:uncharacterized membrane protein
LTSAPIMRLLPSNCASTVGSPVLLPALRPTLLLVAVLLVLRGESFVLSSPTTSSFGSRQHRFRGCRRNDPPYDHGVFLFRRGGGDERTDNPSPHDDSDRPQNRRPKNYIQVSSRLAMPISAAVAFDAFSDLPRQASWSPWLQSVEYVAADDAGTANTGTADASNTTNETKWTMRSVLGVSYSWHSRATQLVRPHVIAWESVRGLRNWGRVEFHNRDDNNSSSNSSHACDMQLTLTFQTPRLVARLFGSEHGRLTRLVQNRMVAQTLRNFRQVVWTHDLARPGEAVVDEAEEEPPRNEDLAAADVAPPLRSSSRYPSIATTTTTDHPAGKER